MTRLEDEINDQIARTNAARLTEIQLNNIEEKNTTTAIQKYDPSYNEPGLMEKSNCGKYVLYEDHYAITNRESPPDSVERLADEALAGFAEFFGKCLQDESFAGLSVQIKFDKLGKPAVYEVAACEMVGTEPMRRVAVKG